MKLPIGKSEDEVTCVLTPNHVVWAIHRLGGIVTALNPTSTVDELLFQLEAAKPSALFVHSDFLTTAAVAAQTLGIKRIVLIQGDSNPTRYLTIDDFVGLGTSSEVEQFVERKLAPGEAKTKPAFLSFSSGTTGKPKLVAVPHTYGRRPAMP
ncbi:hypothetical protein C8J56DRAFT_1043950 [Mycena floridula]|nr:hypothetical protein C8J56DRAFT_1043950 [Mycena floridula]